MAKLVAAMQEKFKDSSKSFALFTFKLFSGLVIGLTLALVAREIIGFSSLMFAFVIISFTGVFLRVVRSWNLLVIVLFDLFAVVAGLLLKMYIVMAPL